MKPIALGIRCFRGWIGSGEVPLDRPLTVVVGKNTDGKSSTLNAIEWCLYGEAVEKKGAGIDERAQWEVRPRAAASDPTEVWLDLEGEDGVWRLLRRRRAGASPRGDEVVLRRPDGGSVEGEPVGRWLRERGLPDWETFRRAHAFHQEAARRRLTESADRSALLADLLGLEEDVEARAVLEDQDGPRLLRDAEAAVDRLESALVDRMASPARDLQERVRVLAVRGVEATTLRPELLADVRGRLVARARALAARLGWRAEVPEPADRDAVRRWAATWAATVHEEGGPLDALRSAVAARAALEPLVQTAAACRDGHGRASAARARAAGEGGDLAARTAAREDARLRLHGAQERQRRTDALAALLGEALDFVRAAPSPTPCPVCETPVEDLAPKLEERAESLRSRATRAAAQEVGAARAALEERTRAEEAFRALVQEETRAEERWTASLAPIEAALGPPAADEGGDLLARARVRLEALEKEIAAGRSIEKARDDDLAAHRSDFELLRDLEAWASAWARVQREVDVTDLEAAAALDRALDDLAGHAADLEALGGMARRAQEQRSVAREVEVGEALGRYYAAITGRPEDEAVRVQVKRTARRIGYELVDTEGRTALPVLNQAAWNALSLAMLFAQAEEQARRGGLALLVLDDPAQSLDHDHATGLARAIDAVSAFTTVVVGATPSPFAERLADYVTRSRRIVTLDAWDRRIGARILSVEES